MGLFSFNKEDHKLSFFSFLKKLLWEASIWVFGIVIILTILTGLFWMAGLAGVKF